MKARTVIVVSLIALLVVGAAGYLGFAQTASPEPTAPPPQTVAVTKCSVERTVEAPGKLENTSETQILMPADGSLSDVLVQAGDKVTAGQVLVRLDDISRAKADIALKDAQAAYKKAYSYRLSLNGKQWIESVIIEYEHGQAVPVIKWQKGVPDAATIQKADNDLALKKAQLDDAQATVDAMELKAPFSGVVTEVDAIAGHAFHKNDTLFKLVDAEALEVRANVTQEDYPLLKTGQPALIYFDARPDVTAHGKVDRIVPRLVAGDSPTYDIFITIDEVPDGLAEGMTVDTNVTIASRPGVLCLPRSVVHASGDNKAMLQVWDGRQTSSRQVTIGLRGDSNVEITSGLTEGEQVVVQ